LRGNLPQVDSLAVATADDGVPAATPTSGRYTVNAVASALGIFAKVVDDGSTSLHAAADAVGVSRSTAYRLLTTLTDLGLLERIPGGGYMPGIEAFRWATRLLEQLDLREIANPILRQLREEQGESVNLALLQGSELIYVEVFESPGILRTVESVGTRVPLHAAAIGKAVAAYVDESHLGQLLGPEPYPRLTSGTITTWSKLAKELAAIREAGYALDLENVEPGVVCIGAPIFRNGRIAGAVSLSGPRTRLTDKAIRTLTPTVCDAAARITGSLSPALAAEDGSSS
jgi:DNA-binding IclR family transcriptional regulator